MSIDKKVKFYKNSDRDFSSNYKAYIPQYKLMGIKPIECNNSLVTDQFMPMTETKSIDNPRAPRAAIRQPYAETVVSPIGNGRGPLPNIGNNIEQTWSSVDGEVIDDVFNVEKDHFTIDNNEFVSAAAFGLPEEMAMKEDLQSLNKTINDPRKKSFVKEHSESFLTKNQLQDVISNENLNNIIKDLEENNYLLIVLGKVICSGYLEFIQDQTRLLIFGEHELYKDINISVDDIVIIKRVPIKVGVFLE